MVFVGKLAVRALCQAHPLAPVVSANVHSREIKILVDLRSVIGHGTGFILATAGKRRIECLGCRGSFVTVKQGKHALELHAGNNFIPAEILSLTVEVSRSNSHVHEAVVRINPLDAVSPITVFTNGGKASTGDVGVGDNGFQRRLFPIDTGSAKVVFEAVAENLE